MDGHGQGLWVQTRLSCENKRLSRNAAAKRRCSAGASLQRMLDRTDSMSIVHLILYTLGFVPPEQTNT